jgi:hypothetical protein
MIRLSVELSVADRIVACDTNTYTFASNYRVVTTVDKTIKWEYFQ